ncbi:aspartyl-phosphate phosphatase Spo0E family protein [uncultured Clostridium sp.]|uniref:aspartyl-phosphate phosphatase Spo0E family protein n=1 Tax=uncultured Clostridium sp. TaxID=59620 RepID=UPI002604F513|nr:aspartyl-phosphate phosphatase Spo0E family protein [uncultured Clostridium sp.]
MEELREELENAINEYGILDKRTIAISKRLDKIICKIQASRFEKFIEHEKRTYPSYQTKSMST